VERQLKERLVGAAVLVAAAVILIPEMLSGPRRPPVSTQTKAAPEKGEGSLKRYTIDLDGPSPAVQSPQVIEAPAPPPEDVPREQETTSAISEAATQETVPADPAPEQPLAADTATPDEQPPPVPTAEAPAIETLPPSAVQPPAPAPAGTRRWAVQLMASTSREEAQREAESLRSSNYAAFVMPVQSGRATLYRVRVGPFTERAQAEDALRKLKTFRSNPIVVAQP
jgi:DedD protein